MKVVVVACRDGDRATGDKAECGGVEEMPVVVVVVEEGSDRSRGKWGKWW